MMLKLGLLPHLFLGGAHEDCSWLFQFIFRLLVYMSFEVDPKIWTRYKTYITSLKEGSNGKKKEFTKV